MYLTYISEIFPDPHREKAGFRPAISGTFSLGTGTFLPFCARPSCYRSRFQAFSCHLDSGNLALGQGFYNTQLSLLTGPAKPVSYNPCHNFSITCSTPHFPTTHTTAYLLLPYGSYHLQFLTIPATPICYRSPIHPLTAGLPSGLSC